MAQIYHAKPTSLKLMEGLVAGLLGGVVVGVIMLAVDLLQSGRPWWSTPGLLGSVFVGSPQANADANTPINIGAVLVGWVLLLVFFGLGGMGLSQYMPIFRRFKIDAILAGAVYGAILYLVFFLYALNVFKSAAFQNLNNIVLPIACVIAGAAMGLWLKRAARPASTH